MTVTAERCAACGEPGHYSDPGKPHWPCIKALRARAEKAEREILVLETVLLERAETLGSKLMAVQAERDVLRRVMAERNRERDSLLREVERLREALQRVLAGEPGADAVLQSTRDAIAEHDRKDAP